MPDTPARPAPTGGSAPPRSNAVVAVLAFAGIVVSLMQTLVIPIVPELPRLLNASPSNTAWAVTATLLAAAADGVREGVSPVAHRFPIGSMSTRTGVPQTRSTS